MIDALPPSQIEQLPDLAGYLKHAADPRRQRLRPDAKRTWEWLRTTASPANHASDRSGSRGNEDMSHE